MDTVDIFTRERPRLVGVAAKVLGDHAEAEDMVQQAWLRLDRTDSAIDNLPGWLTTVTTRLCLDRLRQRVPVPEEDVDVDETVPDPAEDLALTDDVGAALHVVLDRLSPNERVAFVLHDSFGFEFGQIASILDVSPAAARKLASRARAKVARPHDADVLTDAVVVDAFMAAARGGEFSRLLELLAPDAVITADEFAIAAGTPSRIAGREEVATFFNGAAQAALPALVGDQPGAAWYHRGEAKVAFDFTTEGGHVQQIRFRADPELLARITRREES